MKECKCDKILKLEKELTMMFDSDLRVAMALLEEIRKLNQNKEEKMIPLSEVKRILIKFYQGLKNLTEDKDRTHLTYNELDKWIEENL